jgi:hypothetical protein
MKKYKIGIQVGSLGDRCGIATYSKRLCDSLNSLDKDLIGEDVEVEAYQFVNKPKKGTDLINIQYEPGLMPPQLLMKIINKYMQPVIITVHHIGYLPQLFGELEGFVFHNVDQFEDTGSEPLSFAIIPHPALVFEDKNKEELREKFNLPKDKKILGTSGFITGTGKNLPESVKQILIRLKDDEFLYLTTAFWKGGDMGRKDAIMEVVRELGKEDQFRLDTDFVSAEELNEKMQACDLLYAWCVVGPNAKGSQSGIAADMYGSRTKMIVKNSAHYSFIGEQDKVLVGSEGVIDFADDVVKALREEDLEDTQNPEWLSWNEKAKDYLNYFQEVLGE